MLVFRMLCRNCQLYCLETEAQSSHSTNLFDKMLTNFNNITASTDSVISCDNIQFNHSFLCLLAVTKKILDKKNEEYYPHQSADLNKKLSYRRETALQPV